MTALTSTDIITRGFRELNLIPVGKSPTTAELNEGMTKYQSFINSLFGQMIGQLLTPWDLPPAPTSQFPSRFPELPVKSSINDPLGVNTYNNPPPNVRVITNAGITGSLYFPPAPPDGARIGLVNVGADFTVNPLTLDGNGRLINGVKTLTISTNPTGPATYFYRDDLANWLSVQDLTLTSASILPDNFDDFLVCGMAVWIAGSNGVQVTPDVQGRLKNGLKLLKARYTQPQPGISMEGAWRMQPYQSFGNPGWWSGGNF